jgi:hypothetical protein
MRFIYPSIPKENPGGWGPIIFACAAFCEDRSGCPISRGFCEMWEFHQPYPEIFHSGPTWTVLSSPLA